MTRGGLPVWGLGVGLTNLHCKKLICCKKLYLLRIFKKSLRPGRILWINDPSDVIWILDSDYGM
jgi:hypothetical protein